MAKPIKRRRSGQQDSLMQLQNDVCNHQGTVALCYRSLMWHVDASSIFTRNVIPFLLNLGTSRTFTQYSTACKRKKLRAVVPPVIQRVAASASKSNLYFPSLQRQDETLLQSCKTDSMSTKRSTNDVHISRTASVFKHRENVLLRSASINVNQSGEGNINRKEGDCLESCWDRFY